MKKVRTTMLAALVAVSFSGMVFATEIPKSDAKSQTTTATPASEVKVEKKEVKKCVKKHKKHHKKHMKAVVKKDETAPAGPTVPAAK
jgi:hypothetical protein